MVNKNKFGFSLAEALMSMLIMGIIALSLLPILGKQKPGAGGNTVTMQGAFLCYWEAQKDEETGETLKDEEGNVIYKLRQVLIDGRRIVTNELKDIENETEEPSEPSEESENEEEEKVNDLYTCELKENKRVGRFYFLAVGAGSKNTAGQVSTGYTSEIKGDIILAPGLKGDDTEEGKTTIYSSGSQFTALPGYESGTIMPINVDTCKYVSGDCPNKGTGVCKNEETEDRIPTDCSPSNYAGEKDILAITIVGCGCTDAYGNQTDDGSILAKDLVKQNDGTYKHEASGLV